MPPSRCCLRVPARPCHRVRALPPCRHRHGQVPGAGAGGGRQLRDGYQVQEQGERADRGRQEVPGKRRRRGGEENRPEGNQTAQGEAGGTAFFVAISCLNCKGFCVFKLLRLPRTAFTKCHRQKPGRGRLTWALLGFPGAGFDGTLCAVPWPSRCSLGLSAGLDAPGGSWDVLALPGDGAVSVASWWWLSPCPKCLAFPSVDLLETEETLTFQSLGVSP